MPSARRFLTSTRRTSLGAAVGVLLTLPALGLAFLSAGGGHGDYLWAKVLFPYAMIVPVFCGTPISLPLILVACLQFPIYGGLIGTWASGRKSALIVVGSIVGVHVVASVVCLGGTSPYFS